MALVVNFRVISPIIILSFLTNHKYAIDDPNIFYINN